MTTPTPTREAGRVMEASAPLYREPMSELSFSLGRHVPSERLAEQVQEFTETAAKPIGDINPWSMLGRADALLCHAMGRIQQLEDDLAAMRARPFATADMTRLDPDKHDLSH